MPVIYFNNFRGFERTFLRLKDVNFFVGENSTGKSSILKLVAILASQALWQYGEFGKNEISLGSFEDIITSSDPTKSFFEIAIQDSDIDDSNHAFLIKLVFIENNKLPFLKEISYQNNYVNIQAIVEGKILKYRYGANASTNDITSFEYFKHWLGDNHLADVSFSKIDIQYFGVIPVLTQINNQILVNSSKSNYSLHANALEIQLPRFSGKFAWIAPVRAEPLPTYRNEGLSYTPDGRHSPAVLKEILDAQVRHILTKFGADSGLFEEMNIKKLFDAKFIENLKDTKNVEDIKNKLEQSDIFEVRVTVNKESRNIINVGYGVSQILPILIEAIAQPDNTWFALQQPEIHLHPRAQAALGDFVFKTNVIDRQKFIIETHSDYIIDRYRLRLNRAFRASDKKRGIAQVVFFSRTLTGNKLDTIEFNEDGAYPPEQPKEFRDFFVKEQLEIITI